MIHFGSQLVTFVVTGALNESQSNYPNLVCRYEIQCLLLSGISDR